LVGHYAGILFLTIDAYGSVILAVSSYEDDYFELFYGTMQNTNLFLTGMNI